MTVADTTVTLEFTDVAAGVPVVVNIQTNGDPTSIFVSYGASEDRHPASAGVDYVIVMALDLLSFTLTPTASLMTKIAADGHNVIYVSRVVNLTTDFDQDDAFVREKLVSEFNEVWMALQQVTKATGSVGDASQSAAQAAASAAEAAIDAAETEADRVAAAASASAAAASEASALTSKTAAATSATSAGTSATNAAASAASAANSVVVIGDPATIARYNVSNPWSAPQTFNIDVTTTANLFSYGVLNSQGTSVIGNDAADVVYIKGTVVNAEISTQMSATWVNFGKALLDAQLTNAAITGGDVIIFRQQSGGFAYRYTTPTPLVTAGLLGLPNI